MTPREVGPAVDQHGVVGHVLLDEAVSMGVQHLAGEGFDDNKGLVEFTVLTEEDIFGDCLTSLTGVEWDWDRRRGRGDVGVEGGGSIVSERKGLIQSNEYQQRSKRGKCKPSKSANLATT